MKTIIKLGILFSLPMLFTSCDDKYSWSTFHPVEVEFQGLVIEGDSKFHLQASLPAEGGEFKVVSKEDNVEDAYISEIDDENFHEYYRPDNNQMSPYFNSNTWIDGKWWRMEYLKTDNPYEILFQIDPNLSKEPRELRITFGCCYKLSHLLLIQAGRVE